jgi:DNA-binding MarR family transcriptional regulator
MWSGNTMTSEQRFLAESGRYAYEGLDRILHEKARLGILTSLMANPEGLLFADLKTLCQLTDGNLSRHLQVLHEAGLVTICKGGSGRRSQTLAMLTPEGRARFQAYLLVLEQIVQDAATSEKQRQQRQNNTTRLPAQWISIQS